MNTAYVLTDAHGTTSVVALVSNIFAEATRMGLVAPILVNGFEHTALGWRATDEFSWPGITLRA